MMRLCVLFLLLALPAHAQMVLDAEFSAYAQSLVQPLLPKLPHTQGTSFVLIADDSLNAFVDAEKVVHVHAGLFLNAKSASDIQGVLAHELGHISSQHLLRMHDKINTSALPMLAGAAVGVGAVLIGAPQMAAAAMVTGQAASIGQILQFSRTQEAEADQRAIAALHSAGYSAQGMVNTFERIRVESQLSYGNVPAYLMTHPLPQTRLQSLQRAVSMEKEGKTPDETAFNRMSAKVYALTHTPAATLRRYANSESPSRYARAIANIGLGKLDDAARELTPLLKESPNDPFYQELAAQIALQRGNLNAAAEGFTRIVNAHPNHLLIRFQLAETLRNLGNTTAALPHYRKITEEWAVWAEPWRGMGLCWGAEGKLGLSHLALAQAEVYSANAEEAKAHLAIAKNHLKKSPNPQTDGWVSTLENILKTNES